MSRVSEVTRTRNQDATLWVGGGLDERADEELLWELFGQVGPVVDVSVPADRVTGRPAGFAFVEFRTEADAEYAMRVLNMVPLYGKCLRVRRAGEGGPAGAQRIEVGAHLFVGNLAAEATERALYDTFSAFGAIVETRVQRDPETGAARGFGFVSYDAFEAADAAIEALNGQFLFGRPVVVQYGFRKDSRTERHGSAEERELAASARLARAAGGGAGGGGGSGGSGGGGAFALQPNRHFAQAQGVVDGSVAPGVAGGAPGAGGSRMLGLPQPQLPPMLPHAAILPAGLLPLPLPPPPPGFHAAAAVPPPLPAHLLAPAGARADNRPAWQVAAAAAAAQAAAVATQAAAPGS